jgi:phosphoribosylformimino-5-aminoimidazole carboxamide ribotide isomerase
MQLHPGVSRRGPVVIVIPAVDLRDGRCVQLVGGSYDHEMVRIENPLAAAARWESVGFRHLHVVDLDAATGRGSNADVIRRLLEVSRSETQVGGGIRAEADVNQFLSAGAARVIAGTRALEDAAWLEEIATMHPARVIAAVDVRDENVVTRGWASIHDRSIEDVVSALNGLPLAALMVTAVHAEGRMKGTDLQLMETVVVRSEFPVQAAGGIGCVGDLRALAGIGVAAAIVGMALYTGALDAQAIMEEFSQ